MKDPLLNRLEEQITYCEQKLEICREKSFKKTYSAFLRGRIHELRNLKLLISEGTI